MDASGFSDTPFVSVLIPAHNEEDFIGRCISSIQGLDWPAERLEVLVIDHSSTDATATRVHQGGARVLTKSDGKIGSVRNAGLLATTGEFVAYVDADCAVPSTWLRKGIALLETGVSIGAVGGPCLCPVTSTWIERTFAPREPSAGDKKAETLATSSFITRRSLLLEVGLFDETLTSGEDDNISQRIRARDLALISSADCHVVHYGYPRTLRAVARKERWHGSSQLESRAKLDVTLVLTHLFAAATAALPVALPLWLFSRTARSLDVLLAILFIQLLPPLLYAGKRFRSRHREAHLIPAWLTVGYAYFFGRSLGLVSNYSRRCAAFRNAAHRTAPH